MQVSKTSMVHLELRQKDGDKYKVLPPKDGKSADEYALIHSSRDWTQIRERQHHSRVEIDQTRQGARVSKLKMDQELKTFIVFTSLP